MFLEPHMFWGTVLPASSTAGGSRASGLVAPSSGLCLHLHMASHQCLSARLLCVSCTDTCHYLGLTQVVLSSSCLESLTSLHMQALFSQVRLGMKTWMRPLGATIGPTVSITLVPESSGQPGELSLLQRWECWVHQSHSQWIFWCIVASESHPESALKYSHLLGPGGGRYSYTVAQSPAVLNMS